MKSFDQGLSLNRIAVQATIHCLTGCVIGEVLGMVVGTALQWSNAAAVGLSVVLAFLFGYALTLMPLPTTPLNPTFSPRGRRSG